MNKKNLFDSQQPIKWLFYGDSITQGSLHTGGQRSYVELFSERIRYELNRPLDIISNTAFCGFTSRNLIENFERLVADLEPNIVFIMIGMNDCCQNKGIDIKEFERNIAELVELLISINATPFLQTTCPVLAGESGSEDYFSLPVYMNAIRRLSELRKVELIDHDLFWSNNSKLHRQWMNNLIHPNYLGHRAFAKYIYDFFDIYDQRAPSSKLPLIR